MVFQMLKYQVSSDFRETVQAGDTKWSTFSTEMVVKAGTSG
jgi:hypothetical protein